MREDFANPIFSVVQEILAVHELLNRTSQRPEVGGLLETNAT